MAFEIFFTPQARQELQDARGFYYQISPDLASRFLHEVEALLVHIQEKPLRFPVSEAPIRKAVFTGKYPYYFLFSVSGDAIWVLSLSHQRRHPDAWKN